MTLVYWFTIGYTLLILGFLISFDIENRRLKSELLVAQMELGFKPGAKDRDGDGWVQDGTRWARKVEKK